MDHVFGIYQIVIYILKDGKVWHAIIKCTFFQDHASRSRVAVAVHSMLLKNFMLLGQNSKATIFFFCPLSFMPIGFPRFIAPN